MKTYNFSLPYFKQGDDLAHFLEESKGHVPEALLCQAEMLECAADLCRRLAQVKDLTVNADCHMIQVDGPEETLEALVKEGILQVEDWGDDDEDVPLDADPKEGDQ